MKLRCASKPGIFILCVEVRGLGIMACRRTQTRGGGKHDIPFGICLQQGSALETNRKTTLPLHVTFESLTNRRS
jgi:hypothetical protein